MAATVSTTSWLDATRLLGLAVGSRCGTGSGARVSSAPGLVAAVRNGLPLSAIGAVSRGSGVPAEAIVTALRIPARTFARRKAAKQLNADESDRLSRLARTIAFALNVLGKRASAWLSAPNRAVGGATPLSLLDTDVGVRQVEEVLERIRHGIAS